jgi:hypothetical protein
MLLWESQLTTDNSWSHIGTLEEATIAPHSELEQFLGAASMEACNCEQDRAACKAVAGPCTAGYGPAEAGNRNRDRTHKVTRKLVSQTIWRLIVTDKIYLRKAEHSIGAGQYSAEHLPLWLASLFGAHPFPW